MNESHLLVATEKLRCYIEEVWERDMHISTVFTGKGCIPSDV